MINTIVEIIATAMDTIFLLWYVPDFLGTKFYEKKNIKFIFLPALLLLFELSADYLLPGFSLLVMVVHIGIALAYALLICERKVFKAIIATASYILAIMFVGSIVYTFISMIIGDKSDAFQGNNSPARVVYLVICKITEFIIYKVCIFAFHKSGDTDWRSSVFFSFYMTLNVVGLGAIMSISIDDVDGNLTIPVIIVLAVLTISVFFVFFFVQKLLKAQRLDFEYRFIEEKIESDKKILEESNRVFENMNEIRHDLKNHLTIIKGKIKDCDLASCENYIDNIYSKIDDIGSIIHTGNDIVDYLINSKIGHNNDIRVKISGRAEIFSNIQDTDIVGLIGNILDNALEAVKRLDDKIDKRIELYFLKKNNNRIILCKNSVDHLVLDQNMKLPKTKKGPQHGYGNKIINSIAQKYGGFVEYKDDESMFCIQIILPE